MLADEDGKVAEAAAVVIRVSDDDNDKSVGGGTLFWLDISLKAEIWEHLKG